MKKLLALVLALVMLVSFVACAEEGTTKKKKKDTDEETATTQEMTATETEEGKAEIVPGGQTKPGETLPSRYTYEGETVADDENCTIKFTGVEEDEYFGFVIRVEFTNKTEDLDLTLSGSDMAINGVQVSGSVYVEAEPGETVEDEISFYDVPEEIGAYTDILVGLTVFDGETYDDLLKESLHVYPYGERYATCYTREDASADEILVDDENIKVVAYGYDSDDYYGFIVNFYLENKTDLTTYFIADDVLVNGEELDPVFISILPGELVDFHQMDWYESDLEEAGVEEVESIEFTLSVYAYDDDFRRVTYLDESFTLEP